MYLNNSHTQKKWCSSVHALFRSPNIEGEKNVNVLYMQPQFVSCLVDPKLYPFDLYERADNCYLKGFIFQVLWNDKIFNIEITTQHKADTRK